MTDFVSGELVASRTSGFDPQHPAERFLTVTTSSGKTITIFDYGITVVIPISNDVPIGGTYHFLVDLMMANIEQAPFPATAIPWNGLPNTEVWEGTVIDTKWLAPPREYLCAVEDIDRYTFILLETAIGLVTANPVLFRQMTVQAGDRLRWRQKRFDLFAIW